MGSPNPTTESKSQIPVHKKYSSSHRFDIDFLEKDAAYASEFMGMMVPGKKYSVLGWSDGGVTALVLAADYNHKVEKLAVWGTSSYLSEKDIELAESVRDVSKWSERMRQPMEEIYGKDEFPKFWNSWVDAYVNIYKKVGQKWTNLLVLNFCYCISEEERSFLVV